MPNNLVSEKPVELGRLIQVAYLVVILWAFCLGEGAFAAPNSGNSDQLFGSARCVSPGTLEVSPPSGRS